MLTWTLGAVAVCLWGIAALWGVRAIRTYLKLQEDKIANEEVMLVARSEELTIEVMRRYPRSPGPAFVHANHAYHKREFEEALRRYRLAITLCPHDHRGYFGAFVVLSDLKRWDEAEALLRNAIDRFPELKELQRAWALTAHAREDWPNAALRWAEYRASAPGDRLGYDKGLQALCKLGKTAQAEALIAEASIRFPRFPEPAAG